MPRRESFPGSSGFGSFRDAVISALQRSRRVAAPGFRTRDPLRDDRTDKGRIERLGAAIDGLLGEIEAERRGLRRRYDEECTDAGFLLARMEDETGAIPSSGRLNELTRSILQCERRLERLSRQGTFMRQLRNSVERLAADRPFSECPPDDRGQ